jgi:hypothetical protein
MWSGFGDRTAVKELAVGPRFDPVLWHQIVACANCCVLGHERTFLKLLLQLLVFTREPIGHSVTEGNREGTIVMAGHEDSLTVSCCPDLEDSDSFFQLLVPV